MQVAGATLANDVRDVNLTHDNYALAQTCAKFAAMRVRPVAGFLLIVALAAAGACSSSSGAPAAPVCTAGETRVCTGPGACVGGQACAADGSAWGACDCGGAKDAGTDATPADASSDTGSAADAPAADTDAGAADATTDGAPGPVCGDHAVAPPETCDPAAGVTDESCNATTCTTLEQILSNGTIANGFARGNPARKTNLRSGFLADGHYVAAWADAVGAGGSDNGSEITVRRMGASLQTDPTAVLQGELRLQAPGNFSTSGNKTRSGTSDFPSWALVESSNLLVVFQRQPAGDTTPHVYASVQSANLTASVPDVQVSGSAGAGAPSVASASNGDALIVYREGTSVRAVLRRSGGTLSAAPFIAPSGAVGVPRVAWVGGDFVAVWSDGADVQMRRIGADGTPKGLASVANAGRTAGVQDQPDIAAFATGEFLIAYRDNNGDVGGAEIRVQKFDATGTATGTEISSVTNDLVQTGDQGSPAVAAGQNATGQRFYVVVWSDPSAPQVRGRIVNATAAGYLANPVTGLASEFRIGLAPSPRSSPAVAVGGQAPGFIAASWVDESGGDPAGADDRVRVRRLPMP